MIRGITFDKQLMRSADHAHEVNYYYQGDVGVTKGCSVTENVEGNLVVSSGYFIVKGRLIAVDGSEIVDVPAVSSGTLYSTLIFEIDLGIMSELTSFTQGIFKIISDASTYPTLTQQDLDNGGIVYQVEFARFENTVSGVMGLVETKPILNPNKYALNLYGLVANRPTENLEPGVSYFATDLKKRIEYNGNRWQFYDGTLFGVLNIVDGNIYPETAIYTTQTLVGGFNSTPQTVDATKDVIIYTGIKLNDADDYCHISFDIGAVPQFQLSFGYNWITSTKDGFSVSIIDSINSAKTLLGTKIMYDASHDVVVWYDHSTGYVSVYIDNVLLNTWKPSAGADSAGVNQIKLMIGSSSTLVTVNYWYVAKPLVVAIGDSITEGSPLHSPNPEKYPGVDTYRGYPKLISDHLKQNGIKNYFVANKGVGANTTAQMVSRFTSDVLNKNCKYVLIHGGVNDYNDNPTGYTTPINNKISMANSAKSNGVEPMIISVIPTKTSSVAHEFATNVHELEKSSYSAFLNIDLWSTIEGSTPNVADNAKMDDEVHPNETGYTSIADRITQDIEVG